MYSELNVFSYQIKGQSGIKFERRYKYYSILVFFLLKMVVGELKNGFGIYGMCFIGYYSYMGEYWCDKILRIMGFEFFIFLRSFVYYFFNLRII